MPAGSICGSRVRYAGYGRCLTCAASGYYSQCRSVTTSTVVKRRCHVLRMLSDAIPSTWALTFLTFFNVSDNSMCVTFLSSLLEVVWMFLMNWNCIESQCRGLLHVSLLVYYSQCMHLHAVVTTAVCIPYYYSGWNLVFNLTTFYKSYNSLTSGILLIALCILEPPWIQHFNLRYYFVFLCIVTSGDGSKGPPSLDL